MKGLAGRHKNKACAPPLCREPSLVFVSLLVSRLRFSLLNVEWFKDV